MAKRTAKASPRGKDVNYTVAGLLALFGIVLVTAMYFARLDVATPSSGAATQTNTAGLAYGGVDSQSPATCQASRMCQGSKLVIQAADCHQYFSDCKFGCDDTADGAICR